MRDIRIARLASRVHTEDESPYTTSFAQLTASSSSQNRCTVTTGPNTSFCTISESWATSATTVGRVVEAGAVDLLAAGEDLAAGVLCAVDEPGHALALAARDERSHLDLLVVQVADLDGLDGRHELGQEVLVDPGPATTRQEAVQS